VSWCFAGDESNLPVLWATGGIGYANLWPGATPGNLGGFNRKLCAPRNVAKARPALGQYPSHSQANVNFGLPARAEGVVQVHDDPRPNGAPLWEQHPERASSSSAALEMLNYDGTSERNRNTRKNDYPLCIGEILVAIAKHNGCDLADVSKFTLSKARHAHFLKQAQAMRKERKERRDAEAEVALTPARSPRELHAASSPASEGTFEELPDDEKRRWERLSAADELRVSVENEIRVLREGLARRTGNGDGDGDEDDDEGGVDD
jgi:hypothetical protein